MGNVLNVTKKIKVLLDIVKYLKDKRNNIQSLSAEFDINIRTMYRYLKVIEDLGYPIECDFKGKFFIAESQCPLCKETKIFKPEQTAQVRPRHHC